MYVAPISALWLVRPAVCFLKRGHFKVSPLIWPLVGLEPPKREEEGLPGV